MSKVRDGGRHGGEDRQAGRGAERISGREGGKNGLRATYVEFHIVIEYRVPSTIQVNI